MKVKDLKKLLEEKFQDDDLVLINEYNDEGNEYCEAEKDILYLHIFDSEEDEDYNYDSETFEQGTRALVIYKNY